MYARVPPAMAQFVLKIEKLSHIMGPTPILEMARAYGLHVKWQNLIKVNVNVFVLYNNEANHYTCCFLFIAKLYFKKKKAGLCSAFAHFGEHEKKKAI